MRTAFAFWRRSQTAASPSPHVFHRPDEINWMHVALKFALGLILIGNLLRPPLPPKRRTSAHNPRLVRRCKVNKPQLSRARSSIS